MFWLGIANLEAWDIETREKQIKDTLAYMKEIDLPMIVGGDFNTLMPDAPKKSGFVDDPYDNYEGEKTFDWFFKEAKNLNIPQLSTKSHDPFDLYTFPSDHPTRRLDHIFLMGDSLSFINYRVGNEAGTASDHLPIVAIIKYR
jgi:endonuclease/exonuclease/phosphatase family metal-dependent hydrolase